MGRVKKTLSPRPGSEGLSSGLRRYLYITAAVCGAAVLIVEILGAKMLSPYFGTSHFVWTAQIGVTLISLTMGYWFGGWLVDRGTGLNRLYICIVLAALYLFLTVPLCRPVAEAGLGLSLPLGSLLSSLFLFFIPLALLATVGPFLVRVMTASMDVVGSQVGRLTAVSTAGSVAGTIVIGYVLIPFLPNSVTMVCTAFGLIVLAVIFFILWGRKKVRTWLVVLAALAGLGTGWWGVKVDGQLRLPGFVELTRCNSHFGLMQVLASADSPYRYYFNDYLSQNAIDAETKQSIHVFTYLLHGLARAYTEKIEEALCIGLGVGIVPMQLAVEGVKVDVVEINPAVVPLAERYFNFQPGRVNLFLGDGRHFLNRCPRRYDTIILDAFLGDSSPSHLMTLEAFRSMGRTLKPAGVLVINTFGSLVPGEDYSTASLEKTLRRVFRSVKLHCEGPEGNIFFVASNRKELDFLHRPDLIGVHPRVENRVAAALSGLGQADPQQGRVLTDDFNPVEFYDAANRERLRRELASFMIPRGSR
jgi:predicted membrane-bound spermidine synthase